MTERKTILVTGATGQQGGAVVRALAASQAGFRIRALVRDPERPRATDLAKRGIEAAVGNLNDEASIRAALEGVHGVFSVQTPLKNGVEGEERQGKLLATLAKEAGVRHFVYSSVDGAERGSGIPHFESKGRIEEHIRAIGLPYTILRPVYFMDNLSFPAFFRGIFLGMMRSIMGSDAPMQMIAVRDIGTFARLAFERPEDFLGRELAIASDELSIAQQREAFRRATGRRLFVMPVPGALVRLASREMAHMLTWFRDEGYRADIQELRKRYPELLTFEGWLADREADARQTTAGVV